MTLNSSDKEKIKRVVPKSSNKIIDAAIVRLYVNTPDTEQWSWTGLTGAIVLVDDLIGHTFFFKLIDIIGNAGVLWDQELWVDFQYSQDRLFFHSFEIDDYSIGFLFDDKSDAQHFFKRVINRNKHGSKLTVQNNNAVEARKKPEQLSNRGYRGDINATTNNNNDNNNNNIINEQRMRRTKGILYYDNEPPPEWRSFYKELDNMGISEDMIAENREFIKDYISKQGGPLVGLEPPIPRRYQNQLSSTPSRSISQSFKSRSRSTTVNSVNSDRKKKAPPPPPPPQSSSSLTSAQDSYSHSNEISTNNSYQDIDDVIDTPTSDSPISSSIPSTNELSTTSAVPRKHNVPPPMAFPTQFTSTTNVPSSVPPPTFLPPTGQAAGPGLPARAIPPPPSTARPLPNLPSRNAGPPPPPARGNVPPPPPSRVTRPANVPVPPPPRRGNAPPAPPSRNTAVNTNILPSLPTRQPGDQQVQTLPHIQPSPIQAQQRPSMAIPVVHPTHQIPPAMPPSSIPAPPAPPMPASMPSSSVPPPPAPPMPPAMTSSSVPPPPAPPMPTFNTAPAPAQAPLVEATGDVGRDALLASIRGAGLGSLRKVDKSQLDKPSVLLQEARGEPVNVPSSTPSAAPGQPASLADALAAALSSRKAKVAVSDDESDGDW